MEKVNRIWARISVDLLLSDEEMQKCKELIASQGEDARIYPILGLVLMEGRYELNEHEHYVPGPETERLFGRDFDIDF